MKIAIIGAAGNAGQRIVREALSRGQKVTAIGPSPAKLESLGDVAIVVGDITSPADLSRALVARVLESVAFF